MEEIPLVIRRTRRALLITRLDLWLIAYLGMAVGEWLGFTADSIASPIAITVVFGLLLAAWLFRAWVDKRIAEIDAAADDDLRR